MRDDRRRSLDNVPHNPQCPNRLNGRHTWLLIGLRSIEYYLCRWCNEKRKTLDADA